MEPHPSPQPLPAPEIEWTGAARLYRTVCRLRAEGDAAAADALEASEFAAAAQALDLEDPQRLRRLKQAEEDLTAQAERLADLLAPMLARRLRLAPETSRERPARSGPLKPPARPRAEPREIADFLDQMLAQDPAS